MDAETIDHVDGAMYLRPEVKIEPLLLRWHAAPHLMSPIQHCLNIAYRHIPLMQSFVQNPKVHFAASRDPKMFGGPFLSVAEADVALVKSLFEDTKIQCARILEFCNDFKYFRTQLLNNAKGFSLEEYYSKIPAPIQGAVELLYNVNNQPAIYIIEELLQGSELELREGEEICLSRVGETERSFFMSSPRIVKDEDLNLKIKFDDERIDMLAKMRTSPQSIEKVVDNLQIGECPTAKIAQFFTNDAPPRHANVAYEMDDVRVRYLGHASVLLQSKAFSILVDPMFSYEMSDEENKFTFYDLPDVIDYVVISHAHLDHFCPEMLLQIRHRVRKIVVPANNRGSMSDPSLKLILHRLGYRDVTTLSPFETTKFPFGEILSLPFPGEHSELDIQSKQSVKISISGRSFLFLVDSNAVDPHLYRRLAPHVGSIDALFMGMECHGAPLSWQYGPLLTHAIVRRDDESRRLNGSDSERGAKVIDALDCKRVFIYAMGHEKWVRFIVGMDFDPQSYQVAESEKLMAYCRQLGIPAERLYEYRELVF